jgi:hypothetical protein
MRDVLLSARRMTSGNEAITVGAGRVVGQLNEAVWRRDERETIRRSNKDAVRPLCFPAISMTLNWAGFEAV